MLQIQPSPLPKPELDEIAKTTRSPGYMKIIGLLAAQEAMETIAAGRQQIEGRDPTDHVEAAKLFGKMIDTLHRIAETPEKYGSVKLTVSTEQAES